MARAPARASSLPLGHALKHRARSRDRTPARLSRPGRGYLFECPDSGQTRPKPPDVLNRPLKSCGFLRRHGGARPCLSRIVTTSTLAIPCGRLGAGRASFTGFRATAGGPGLRMLENSTCSQANDQASLGCACPSSRKRSQTCQWLLGDWSCRRRERRMLDAVKALPEVLKNWKTNKDIMFQWVACAAALITVASWIRDQRPSEVIAEVLRLVGVRSASDSFLSGLPPVLASPNPGAQHIVEALVALVLIFMVFGPLYNAWRDDWDADLQARALLGAPAPGTFWLLLMVAGQFGPPDWVLSSTRCIAYAVSVVAILGMLIYLACRRGGDGLDSRASAKIKLVSYRASAMLLMSVLGIAIAAIGPVARVISWLASTESDAYRDMKLRIAGEWFESRKPDGAVQVPKAVSLPESEFGRNE